MLLSLAACGGKNENPENSKTPADSTASTPATTPESSTGQEIQPETTPDDTAELAFTVTETGVYLYDGTFLATGETVKLNDAGASIDMPSVTIGNGDNSDITYLFDGKSPVGGGVTTNVSAGQYWHGYQTPTVTVLNNTQEIMNCNQCLGVYADFSINRDPSKGSAYSLNGELFGKGRETYPMARILEILGAPVGAYCAINTYHDANKNNVIRPRSVIYFWKSSNFEEGGLVLAFEIQYSWTARDYSVVEESDNSHLYVILTDHIEKMGDYSGHVDDMLPGMQELGLY